MALNMERKDYAVVGGGIALAVAVGAFFLAMEAGPAMEQTFRWITGLAIAGAVVVIYKARDLWGGEIARSLEIIASGLVMFMLQWIPHIQWHQIGAAQAVQGGSPMPAWFGVPGPWWLGFWHGLGLAAFLIIGYGFYTLWKAGKE